MSELSRPEVCIVAAIIRDDRDRLLLVRKSGTSRFMLPGGKPEPGETTHDALVRELAEELGVGLSRPPTARGWYTARAANEPDLMVRALVFDATPDGPVSPQAEIAELVWSKPEDIAPNRLAPLVHDHFLGPHR